MSLFLLVDHWPDFIQYIVLENLWPFKLVADLASTCKQLNQLIKNKFNVYRIICDACIINDSSIFSNTSLFYTNDYEWNIFNHIYKSFKYKYYFNASIKSNNLVNAEWLLKNKMVDNDDTIYSDTIHYLFDQEMFDALNLLIKYNVHIKYEMWKVIKNNNSIKVLDWLFNNRNTKVKFEYDENFYDFVLMSYDEEKCLWWLNKLELYPNIINFNIDLLLTINCCSIETLKYCLDKHIFTENIIESSLNFASIRYIKILDWWNNRNKK